MQNDPIESYIIIKTYSVLWKVMNQKSYLSESKGMVLKYYFCKGESSQ